jgi:hypothetical protein
MVYQSLLRACSPDQIAWHLIRPGKGFHALDQLHIRRDIRQAFLDLGELSQAFHAYLTSHGETIKTDLLLDCASILQHRLLSLPHVLRRGVNHEILNEVRTGMDKQMSLAVYEAVRLAALLYSLHVLYPHPRCSTLVTPAILPSLCRVLRACDALCLSGDVQEVLLWCAFVGAVAGGRENGDGRWLASHTLKLVYLQDIKTFRQLKELLKSMAWLEGACDEGGLAIWNTFSR